MPSRPKSGSCGRARPQILKLFSRLPITKARRSAKITNSIKTTRSCSSCFRVFVIIRLRKSAATLMIAHETLGRHVKSSPSAHPPYYAGHAVDSDLRTIRDAAGGVGHAEHHRHTAFARERREMR